MFRLPKGSRRSVAVGVPVLLIALLVGCGRQEAEVARQQAEADAARAEAARAEAEAERARQLAAIDRGLRAEIDRIDKTKVDAAVTQGRVGEPKLEDLSPVIGGAPTPVIPGGAVPPGTVVPTNPVNDSVIMGGSGAGKLSASFPGRSGATKWANLPAGGMVGPRPAGAAKAAPEGYNAQNAEQYGVYAENEFRSPLVAALSTFSADVNTASYANVRRILQGGKLPPKDAVFLAEFVNYFPYSYAKPKGEDPVAFHVELGPCPWNRKHHLVRVGMQAQQIPADKLPARNLVFLIDTSGSMQQDNRLPLVQKSLALLVEQLTEKDRVSIVTYAGDSRVALMPTKGSDKKVILSTVNGLSAGGSTNGEGGLRKAYELAKETFIADGVNRVILCTDGDFNVGVADNGALVKLIEEQRKSKVFLTILGYGMGNYKDDRLKELANHGNGHHAYVDTLDEARKVFVEQGGALVCVAKDVKFQVDFNPARVTAYRLVGYENRLLKDEDFRDDKKDAGDLGSGHQVTVLYEVVPAGVEIELPKVDPAKVEKKGAPARAADEWLTVKMRYKHPEAETSKELAQPLKGEVAKDLSDDFRFASAAASFGMLLRDSRYRGAMTYAGVLEEAKGCLGQDPGGHRKQFLELVKIARDMAGVTPGVPGAGVDQATLRKLAESWSNDVDAKGKQKLEEVLATVPPKYHAAIREYFKKLEAAQK